jgi:hypothetical protein
MGMGETRMLQVIKSIETKTMPKEPSAEVLNEMRRLHFLEFGVDAMPGYFKRIYEHLFSALPA